MQDSRSPVFAWESVVDAGESKVLPQELVSVVFTFVPTDPATICRIQLLCRATRLWNEHVLRNQKQAYEDAYQTLEEVLGDERATLLREGSLPIMCFISCGLYNDTIKVSETEAIAQVLKVNTTVSELTFYNNRLFDAGGIALGEVLLVNTSLSKLELCNNGIGLEGLEASEGH